MEILKPFDIANRLVHKPYSIEGDALIHKLMLNSFRFEKDGARIVA